MTTKHRILIIGGGSAGITVAAHLAIPGAPDGAVRFAAAIGFVAGFADWLVAGRSEEALEQFLEMLRGNREFEDGLPKKALIDAFRVVEDEDLVGRYRRKMASLLF